MISVLILPEVPPEADLAILIQDLEEVITIWAPAVVVMLTLIEVSVEVLQEVEEVMYSLSVEEVVLVAAMVEVLAALQVEAAEVPVADLPQLRFVLSLEADIN